MKHEILYLVSLVCLQAWWLVIFDVGGTLAKAVVGFGIGGAMITLYFSYVEHKKNRLFFEGEESKRVAKKL